MCAFLCTQGLSWKELLDYEDGLPLDQLLDLNVEVGRLALQREKREVNAMVVALSSLFSKDLLERFNQESDQLLKSVEGGLERTPTGGGAAPQSEGQKQAQVEHTIHELNKLNVLLR